MILLYIILFLFCLCGSGGLFLILQSIPLIESSLNINTEQISFKKSYHKAKLPYLHIVEIENQQLSQTCAFLLDTGTNGNFITKTIVQSVKPDYQHDVEYDDDVLSLTGTMMLNQSLPLSFKINERTYQDTFILTDDTESFKFMSQEYGIPIIGIIGSEFFRKYRFDINYNTLTVNIPKC